MGRNLNLVNLGGFLRLRLSLKQAIAEDQDDYDDQCSPWRHSLSMAFNWVSCLKITLLFFLIAAIATASLTLPVEQQTYIKRLLTMGQARSWALGSTCAMVVAYIPLTVLAVPASMLTLGGGYLFGLPVGFIADSIGSTVGAAAAFLLGRTIGRSFVASKLNDYPQFQAVAIATQKSGFKIISLLRLVPIIPFNMLNYALSVAPIPLGKYILASWLGMMPVTLALVYIGTTLRDLSDVTHGWHDFSKAHWALIITGLVVSVVVLICVTKVAKDALERALAENEDIDSIAASPELPVVADPTADLHQLLMITINQDDHEN
ncbi:unnamed protein product [Camellia sinensis]